MTPELYKDLIVTPTLVYLSSYNLKIKSDEAIDLLAGTAMAESDLIHTKQIGGPALSLLQIEPSTHDDCFTNYLDFPSRKKLRALISTLIWGRDKYDNRLRNLEQNQLYACAIARVKYWRVKEAIPKYKGDIDAYAMALSQYHKKYYNSVLGKADAEKNFDKFKIVAKLRYCE